MTEVVCIAHRDTNIYNWVLYRKSLPIPGLDRNTDAEQILTKKESDK